MESKYTARLIAAATFLFVAFQMIEPYSKTNNFIYITIGIVMSALSLAILQEKHGI